jgi:hypothetical protein
MTKICFKCKESKDVEEFVPRSDNKFKRQSYCRSCKRIYDNEYHRKRSVEAKKHKNKSQKLRLQILKNWIYIYLKKRGCVDCGENDVVVLEFDHLRDKSYNISDMLRHGYSIQNLEKEIKKCEVVCANCHRRRTAKRDNWYRRFY